MDCLVRDNAAGVMQGCHYTGANIFHPRPHLGAVQADAAHMQPTPIPSCWHQEVNKWEGIIIYMLIFNVGGKAGWKEAGWKRHGGLIIC